MKFLRMADPQGRDVWIVPRWVTRVSHPVPNQQAKNARAVVWMGVNQQSVAEPPERVVEMLEASEE